ncbi:MAG: EAL and HDOD domain-containing protein [Acidobacteriaceae bacterium]
MQYVARQPILDAKCSLRAYELLFRDSPENRCIAQNADFASKKTVDTAVLFGLDTLSDGHSVFLNCTHDFIVDGLPTLFPSETTVIEILESARPTAELVRAAKRLRQSGYRIALDDFAPQPGYEALIGIADIIKIDFRQSSREECAAFVARYGNGRDMLAEKLETEEEFRFALDLGYSLFQGYFFSRPQVLCTKDVEGLDANQLRILQILAKPRLDFVEIEKIIKSDPALCYRLLRFLNSPAFYLHSEIRSILHALTLLGEEEVRKWLMVATVVLGLQAKNPQLLSTMLVRARFAELVAPAAGLPGASMFIVGMLSLMDAVLGIPKAMLADRVAVADDIRAALKGEGNLLERCLELVTAFERADWNRLEEIRRAWHISSETLPRSYLEAVQWTKRATEI